MLISGKFLRITGIGHVKSDSQRIVGSSSPSTVARILSSRPSAIIVLKTVSASRPEPLKHCMKLRSILILSNGTRCNAQRPTPCAYRRGRAPSRGYAFLLDRRICRGYAFSYRVQSQVTFIEFDHHAGVFLTNAKPAQFHVHTIVRTPNGCDYGFDLLRRHYEHSPHHNQQQGADQD
jgi:hypothetical protein